jgi:hypothetical protein
MGKHQDYTQRKQSMHITDQARFLMLYKAKLDGFRQNIPVHRESICVMRDLIEAESPGGRRQSILRLDQILETIEKRIDDRENQEQGDIAKLLEDSTSERTDGGEEGQKDVETKELGDANSPQFKLDLFNTVPSAEGTGSPEDELSEADFEEPSPAEKPPVPLFIPKIAGNLISRSNNTSPVSFLAGRRPLLAPRSRSLQSIPKCNNV